jgi:hypothetical protein
VLVRPWTEYLYIFSLHCADPTPFHCIAVECTTLYGTVLHFEVCPDYALCTQSSSSMAVWYRSVGNVAETCVLCLGTGIPTLICTPDSTSLCLPTRRLTQQTVNCAIVYCKYRSISLFAAPGPGAQYYSRALIAPVTLRVHSSLP